MDVREAEYLMGAARDALAGKQAVRGMRRIKLQPDGTRCRYVLKSRGRTGAAIRYVISERIRDRRLLEPVLDRQTKRKGAPRGSRRGHHTCGASPVGDGLRLLRGLVKLLSGAELLPYRAPTRAKRMDDHRRKMLRKGHR